MTFKFNNVYVENTGCVTGPYEKKGPLGNKYDKSYLRLYDNYLKLGKKEQAAFFGNSLLKFDEETLKKYENYDKIKADIENLNKTLLDELNAKKAKEKKEMMKKIGKDAIPVVILIAAVAIYFFVFKKKQITK